jgi:hypothetical protein
MIEFDACIWKDADAACFWILPGTLKSTLSLSQEILFPAYAEWNNNQEHDHCKAHSYK